LANRVCRRLAGSTSIQPAALASGLTLTKSGALCSGVTWIMSNRLLISVTVPSAAVAEKMAVLAGPSIAVKLCLKPTSMPYCAIARCSGGTKNGTPNKTSPATGLFNADEWR